MLVEFADGTVATMHDPELASLKHGPICRSVFFPASWELEVELASGRTHRFEISDGRSASSQLGGRDVVYLDQNKWIDLARAVHAPEKLTSPSEREACEAFVALAEDGRLVCPFSSGHLAETGTLDGPRRDHLASMMANLSRGWTFRNVLAVRHDELSASLVGHFRGEQVGAPEVVTLDAREVLASWPYSTPTTVVEHADLDAALAEVVDQLGATAAVFAVLSDGSESSANLEADIAGEGWAAKLAQQAQDLVECPVAERREATRIWFLQDLLTDLANAARVTGLGAAEVNEWVASVAEEEVGRMPYLGRMRDVIDFRQRNPQDAWTKNDLVDLNYLAMAAGYADVVIGERKTISFLRRAQRGREDVGAQLHTSFVDYLQMS